MAGSTGRGRAARQSVIGIAVIGLVSGWFGAPPAEAHPEACVAVYPVDCSYEAHHLVGCAFMGHVVIHVDGVEVVDAVAATPDEGFDGCTDIAPGFVEVFPQTPGTWAVVGNDNLDFGEPPDPNGRSLVNPSLLRHVNGALPKPLHQLLAHTGPPPLDAGAEEPEHEANLSQGG